MERRVPTVGTEGDRGIRDKRWKMAVAEGRKGENDCRRRTKRRMTLGFTVGNLALRGKICTVADTSSLVDSGGE